MEGNLILANIEIEYDSFINNINEIKTLCENNPTKIKIERNNNSVNVKNENNSENNLCHVITVTEEWARWSLELTNKILIIPEQLLNMLSILSDTSNIQDLLELGINESIKLINNEFEKIINDPNKSKKLKTIIKKIIKYTKLIILKVKEILLKGQLFVYKNLKKALENLSNGKFNEEFRRIYPSVLETIQKTSDIISIGLEIINDIISTLGVSMLSLEGGSMSFFTTPKTLVNGLVHKNMKPVEPNNDLSGSLAIDEADKVINEINDDIKNKNNIKKISYIKTQIDSYIETGQMPEAKNIGLLSSDYNIVIDKVINLISTISISEPLPEYKKLNITNIRYLIWLNTVFVPAMKTCFGIPGMP